MKAEVEYQLSRWLCRNMGFNHNVTLAAFWVSYEDFRDRALLSQVENETTACADATKPSAIDVENLVTMPLLQAIWVETLGLRVHNFMSLKVSQADININNWLVPRGNIVFTSSMRAHMDTRSWSCGPDHAHPIVSGATKRRHSIRHK